MKEYASKAVSLYKEYDITGMHKYKPCQIHRLIYGNRSCLETKCPFCIELETSTTCYIYTRINNIK